MPNFCNIIVTGHLGKDPETRDVGQTSVTGFSLAVNTGFGEKKTTTWYNVSIFGKGGERAAQYLSKGDAVTVSGEFMLRPYTDKTGAERMSADIRADRWAFAGSKDQSTNGQPSSPPSDTQGGPAGGFNDGWDDPVPF